MLWWRILLVLAASTFGLRRSDNLTESSSAHVASPSVETAFVQKADGLQSESASATLIVSFETALKDEMTWKWFGITIACVLLFFCCCATFVYYFVLEEDDT
eukprot:TRINITY_DN40683_c0_g1_i1.p1 TRINITY_DN40683_c0_g1~~TRINITY_DN40683_c0_g1_i1.p1  ORF type:complete len:102 (+),score=12.76 TRINITY_DN40683_c0_g1_i1:65-370(+)